MRTLRFADGPDEVHNRAIARNEFGKYGDYKADIASSGDIGVAANFVSREGGASSPRRSAGTDSRIRRRQLE